MAAISNTSASTSVSASASIRQRQTSALSPGEKPDEQEIRQMASEINRTGDRPLWFDDRDERMQAFARQAAQLPADARPQLLKEIIDQRPDAIHDWVGAQRLEQLAGAGRISAEEKAAVQSTVAAAYTEGHITHAQMQTIMGVASMPPGHNPARFETARNFLTGNAPEMAGARAKFLRDSFAAHVERAANGYGGRPDFNSALALTLMQSGGQQSDVARIFSKLTPAEQSLAAAGVGAAAVGYRYSQPHVNGLTDPWAVLHRAVVQANPPATRQGQLQLTRMAEGLASSRRYATPESDKAVTDLYAQVAEGRARQKMDDPQAMAEGLARVANAESRAAGVLKTLPPDASAEQIWQAIQKNPGAFTDPVFVQYLELRGDQARHLQGSDLRNDIGLALGLPVTQTPANEVQQARMERGEFDFFNVNAADGAGQAIRSIEAQIQKAGGEGARVAALPVTVASKEHGLIQTVIWRVETADGQEKFVDYNPATQEARTYTSFEDWKNNNQLPPGEMTYARNGHLTAGVDGKPQLETGNTPNTVDTAWEAWIKPALDGAALVGGVVLLGAAVVGTGGTAVMVGGALLGAYGAGTGGVELADRAAHGQTLSLGNAQARNAWLNVGASALSLGAMGASMRLANMSGRATGNAIDEAVQLTRMAQTARGLNVAAQYADTAAFADGGLMLAANWDRMTPAERTQALAMMAFWSAGTAVSARQAGGVKNLYGVKDFSNAISNTHQWLKSQEGMIGDVLHRDIQSSSRLMGRSPGPAPVAQLETAEVESAPVSQPNNVPKNRINDKNIGRVESVTLAQPGISNLPLPRSPELGPVSTTSELLKKGYIPGTDGVILDQNRVLFNDLWQLTEKTGVEFALTRENGRYILRSGSPISVPIPPNVRPIAHTHPLDRDGVNNPLPSRADINVLNRYWKQHPNEPRPVSQIIIGPDETTRFWATGQEEWKTKRKERWKKR